MKKTAMVLGLAALIAGTSFAWGMGGMGPMANPDFEWKAGTSVTSEYKKLTGTLQIGQKLATTFKADGTEYTIFLPLNVPALADIKNGDTITFEGIVTTVKSDTKIAPVFHPLKALVAGKEVDLEAYGRGGQGPMGQGMGRGGMRGGRGR